MLSMSRVLPRRFAASNHQRRVPGFRRFEVGLLSHCNIIGLPAGFGQCRDGGLLERRVIGVSGADRIADTSQFLERRTASARSVGDR